MSDYPQLRMRHLRQTAVPEMPTLPNGYRMRAATEQDVTEVARVLGISFREPWSIERTNEVLLKNVDVPITYVIEHDGALVATASYQLQPENFPNSGWVHYVGADPGHAGKKLGFIVVLAVMQEAVRRGNDYIYLTTDDPRLPAIKTYLDLGFEPDLWHETHPARWKSVFEALGR